MNRLSSNKRWGYTLIEVMIAMVILVIMMGFLFQFIISAQRIWSASTRTSTVFDQAQLIFQLIEDDLKSAIFQADEDQPGRAIPGYLLTDAGGKPKLGLITQSAAATNAATAAVVYELKIDSVTDMHTLFRHSPTTPNWNFYGDLAYDFSDLGAATEADTVATGIKDMTIYLAGPGNSTSPGPFYLRPKAIKIDLTLFDNESVLTLIQGGVAKDSDAVINKIDETSRAFTKVIFLTQK